MLNSDHIMSLRARQSRAWQSLYCKKMIQKAPRSNLVFSPPFYRRFSLTADSAHYPDLFSHRRHDDVIHSPQLHHSQFLFDTCPERSRKTAIPIKTVFCLLSYYSSLLAAEVMTGITSLRLYDKYPLVIFVLANMKPERMDLTFFGFKLNNIFSIKAAKFYRAFTICCGIDFCFPFLVD